MRNVDNITDFLRTTYQKEVVRTLYTVMFPVDPGTIKHALYEAGKIDFFERYSNYYKSYTNFHKVNRRDTGKNPEEILKILENYFLTLDRKRVRFIIDHAFPWYEAYNLLADESFNTDFWSEVNDAISSWLRKTFGDQIGIIVRLKNSGLSRIFGFDASYLPEWHPYKNLLLQSKSFTDKKAVFGQL